MSTSLITTPPRARRTASLDQAPSTPTPGSSRRTAINVTGEGSLEANSNRLAFSSVREAGGVVSNRSAQSSKGMLTPPIGRSRFPTTDRASDSNTGKQEDNAGRDVPAIDRMLEKIPQSVWHPNAVVPLHRRKANLYWLLLLIGYAVYIALAIHDALKRRKNPPVQLKHIQEPFQLPDVGFCFEGDTYGSRFGCYDETDGKACADSYIGDVFVYGYNYTGYSTPEGYPSSDEYIVLLPEVLSDTCRRFRLSKLTATEDAPAWLFHMLMFWNSSYDASLYPGAFESIKMYLYKGDMTAEEVISTPITLYSPISFDAAVVPFVRGFLEYEQQVSLGDHVGHTYKVVDTTTSPWHNAEDAVGLSQDYGTDSLASIQLDIRSQTYFQYAEVDPLDIVGTLGEITGFWLVVPLLFGMLFYRREARDEDFAELRSFSLCKNRKISLSKAQTGFTEQV